LQLPDDLGRLAVTVETALFRIMQEALTNVHRHSGSPRVDITLTADERTAALTVRDYGKGIPEPVLSGFRKSGINVGVGLAGIRERVKELGGSFEIQGSGGGTTLKVSIPVGERGRNVFAGPPSSQIYSSFAT
jgi:signal transduction histidine kinase